MQHQGSEFTDAQANVQDAYGGSDTQAVTVHVVAKGVAPEERAILATVPSHSGGDPLPANVPQPETYRQALKVILATPEIQGRLHYITAGVIVAIFGGWLAGKAVSSRAFALIFDAALILLSAAILGVLIGLILVENFSPTETIPVVLLGLTGAILFLLGILVGAFTPSQSPDVLPESWVRHKMVLTAAKASPSPLRRRSSEQEQRF